MKTLDWFEFFAPRRGATHERGKLKRLVDLLTRGATPVAKRVKVIAQARRLSLWTMAMATKVHNA